MSLTLDMPTDLDIYVDDLFELCEPEILPVINKEPIDMIVEHGRGSQQKLRDAGCSIIFQTEPKNPANNKFYGFKSEAARDEIAKEMIETEIVERINGKVSARAYLDIDAPVDASDAELNEIAVMFADVSKLYGATANFEPIVNYCDRVDKRSRHFISDGWSLPDGNHVRQFAEDVKSALRGKRSADWVDHSGGSNSYGLRIAGCPKAGNASAKLLGPLTWLQNSSDIVLPVVIVDKPISFPKDIPDTPEVKEFILDVSRKFSNVYHFDGLCANRRIPSYCEACERSHSKAGAYISISKDGSLFFRCRRTPKNGPTLASFIVPASLPKQPPAVDKYDTVLNPEIVGGPGIYNSRAIHDNGKSDLYIQSSWGTGKSYHINEIIRKAVSRNSNTKVLIVSCRKTLSCQISHDVGAKTYDRIKGDLDVSRDKVTVWQIDSLDRVSSDTKFDLLYIDELSQLSAHVWGGGSINHRARGGLSQLRKLIGNAGRVIVTDNDLTDAQITAFKEIRIGKKSRTFSNSYKPWADTKISLFKGKLSVEKVMAAMLEFVEKNTELRKAGLEWQSAVIPCHSLKIARAIDVDLRAKGHTTLLYTSETDDFVKREAFKDASVAWGGPLRPSAVIYTSAVSVGVSCNLKEFSHCFAFFRARNCAATQSAQMLFRCRALKNIDISYDNSGSNAYAPQYPKDLFKWVTLARNLSSLPDDFRDDRCAFIKLESSKSAKDLELLLSDSFEGRLWVAQSIDANRSSAWFCERLTSILQRAGMVVEYEKIEKKVESNVMESIELSSAIAENKRSEAMAIAMPEASAKALEPDKDNELPDKTQFEKDGNLAKWIAMNMGKSPEDICKLGTEAASLWLKTYEPMATQFKHATTLIEDKKCAAPDGDGECVKSQQEAIAVCALVFDAIKISPSDETNIIAPDAITSDSVKDIVIRINKHCGRLFNEPNGPRRVKTLGDWSTLGGRQKQSIVSTLNAALDYVGCKITAYYATPKNKKDGKVARYDISWKWTDCSVEPTIDHPKKYIDVSKMSVDVSQSEVEELLAQIFE